MITAKIWRLPKTTSDRIKLLGSTTGETVREAEDNAKIQFPVLTEEECLIIFFDKKGEKIFSKTSP